MARANRTSSERFDALMMMDDETDAVDVDLVGLVIEEVWLSCNECGQVAARSSGRRGVSTAPATSELTVVAHLLEAGPGRTVSGQVHRR